jgi:integrase/recombinase XerD
VTAAPTCLSERSTAAAVADVANAVLGVDPATGDGRGLLDSVGEFVSLQIEDISLKENLVIVRDGKGGKRREVPITEALSRELRLHIGGRNTGPLFQSPRGGTYSARRIQQIVKETAQEAGIQKRVYPHLLRHTMATRLVNSGMPIEHVRKVLGHESIDTTRVYAETATNSVQESFQEAAENG